MASSEFVCAWLLLSLLHFGGFAIVFLLLLPSTYTSKNSFAKTDDSIMPPHQPLNRRLSKPLYTGDMSLSWKQIRRKLSALSPWACGGGVGMCFILALLAYFRTPSGEHVRVDKRKPIQRAENNPLAPKRVHVFYHTFGGGSPTHREHLKGIVVEQVHQIGQASITLGGTKTQWTLHYRSVGEEGIVKPYLIDPICMEYDKMDCIYHGHLESGHEEPTLQQLHDFCRENPKETVVYVHSKGSYHDKPLNNAWRGPLTGGALSPSCLEALQQHPKEKERLSCNVCGLQFYPIWNLMYPGNMWSANCGYVAKLNTLSEYRDKMTDIVNVDITDTDIWKYDLYEDYFIENKVDITGLERYANEQWVGSHPSVRPCDLMGTKTTKLFPLAMPDQGERDKFLQTAEASAAPGKQLSKAKFFRFNRTKFNNEYAPSADHDTAAMEKPYEYFLLPGILYRFLKIYNKFPPASSWIWDYYPSGKEWKAKIDSVSRSKDGTLDESQIW